MNGKMTQTTIWTSGADYCGYYKMRDASKTPDDLAGEFIVVIEHNLDDVGGNVYTTFSDAMCAAMSAHYGGHDQEDIVILDMASNGCWRICADDENDELSLREQGKHRDDHGVVRRGVEPRKVTSCSIS